MSDHTTETSSARFGLREPMGTVALYILLFFLCFGTVGVVLFVGAVAGASITPVTLFAACVVTAFVWGSILVTTTVRHWNIQREALRANPPVPWPIDLQF